MKIVEWFKRFFGEKKTGGLSRTDIEAFDMAAVEVCVRELAFQSAVNLLAGAVSKCEFRTLEKGVPNQRDEYYLWNVRPNKNQSAGAFVQKLIYQLYRRNHALIIEMDKELYVADDFQMETFALRDYKFSGVTVDGYTFTRIFWMSDVIYIPLHSRDINRVLELLYDSYGKLLSCGMRAYQRGRGVRGILNISTKAQREPDFEETYKQLTGTDLKTFIRSDYAVLPQYEGMTYEELGSKTYAAENSRDIKAMVDDIFEFTAKAFSIPASILKGEVADTSVAVDNLLTFAVDPLVKRIATEINAKRFTKAEYLAGTRLEICTHIIRHVDLFDIAPNLDKLVSSGLFSVNEVLALLGEPKIDEPWADKHFITRNYGSVEELLQELKGGEKA